LLGLIPQYYRSPIDPETLGTTTNYFAVVGPHAPWGNRIDDVRRNDASHPAEIMLIELTGLNTPWMEPRDLTLDQVLDILRPDNGDAADGGPTDDIMYITIHGEVRTVPRNIDRASLRKLFLGGE
jgi:hypothetical protein